MNILIKNANKVTLLGDMKKIIVLVLLCFALFYVSACGVNSDSASSTCTDYSASQSGESVDDPIELPFDPF